MQKPVTDGLPPLPPEDLVEMLREAAQEETDELNEDIPEAAFKLGLVKNHLVEDDLQWWAADCIERLVRQIEDMETSPRTQVEKTVMTAEMTTGQYRAIVAYLSFWTPRHPQMSIDQAISDLGIQVKKSDVIAQLFSCGHTWDEENNRLIVDDYPEDDGTG